MAEPIAQADQRPDVAQTPAQRYAVGTRVLCADGQPLGEVVATYREHLIVERGAFFPTAMFVPYAAISQTGIGDIVLSLTAHDAHAQGWHLLPEDPPMPEPETRAALTSAQPAPVRRAAAPASSSPTVMEPAGQAAPAAAPSPVSTTQVPTETTSVGPTRPADTPAERPSDIQDAPGETSITTAPPRAERPELEARVEPPSPAPIEVQAMEPDASVPPSEEPDPGPSATIGIPGRRLTDAELWLLLEPRAQAAAADDGDEVEAPGDPAVEESAGAKGETAP